MSTFLCDFRLELFIVFLLCSPDVQFCGYTIPHPAENTMHLKVQTVEGTRAIDIFKRALEETTKICDLLIEKFPKS